MSCLQLTKGELDEMTRIIRDFWWQSNNSPCHSARIHYESWTFYMGAKGGELGIRCLVDMNHAFMAKQG